MIIQVFKTDGLNCLYISDSASKKRVTEHLEAADSVDFVIGNSNNVWNFDVGVPVYTLPLICLAEAEKLYNRFESEKNVETRQCFNFMINKKMLHRYLVCRLVEYFELKNYDYTYSGSCLNINDELIFRELDLCDPGRTIFTKQTMSEILGPVTLPVKFLGVDNDADQIAVTGQNARCGDNIYAWRAGLDKIFQSSLISMITESNDGHYEICDWSEKTVYAILGLTIPVWPGAPGHADQFRLMGFDSFDDIVDHSYQYESTLFMRCYRAFEKNLYVLKDINHARSLRQKIMPRLIENRKCLVSNLQRFCKTRLEKWPSHVTTAYQQIKWIDRHIQQIQIS